MNKLLLPFLPMIMEMLTGRKTDSGVVGQVQLLNFVTSEVKKQISTLILKVAAALVATGLAIYSIITVARYINAEMLTYQNGAAISAVFFFIVAAACGLGVWALFKPEKNTMSLESLKAEAHDFKFETIFNNFMDGLAEGAAKARAEKAMADAVKPEPTVVTEEEKFAARTEQYRYSPDAH